MSRSETRFSTTAGVGPGVGGGVHVRPRGRSPKSRACAGSVTRSGLSVLDSSLNTPTTRNAAAAAVGAQGADGLARLDAVVVGVAPCAPASGGRSARAAWPPSPASNSSLTIRPRVWGCDAADVLALLLLADDLGLDAAEGADLVDAAHAGDRPGTSAGMGEKPSLFWVTRSALMPFWIESASELEMPEANTVTKVTSATPIISAAAVTAVRPGLAGGVLARQPAGHAAQALDRLADESRQRLDQLGAVQRDGEQDGRGAAAHQAGRGAALAAAEQADQQQGQAAGGQERR